MICGSSWPIARYIFSSVGVMSWSSPTMQAGEVVSREESRTSLTVSSRVVAIQPSSAAKSFSFSAVSASFSADSPSRSTWPFAIDWNSLPSNPDTASTHISSIGSVSTSTSKPLARNASRCGEFSMLARDSPVR